MNYTRFKYYWGIGRELLWPFQLSKLSNYILYRGMIPFVRRWGPDTLLYCPPNVMVAVTARCNRSCNFCFYYGDLNRDTAERLELTYDKFLEIIEHPLVNRALRIALTGGEPLLNAEICKMVHAAKQKGHIVSIITNGTLLDRYASKLLEYPPDHMTISYHDDNRKTLTKILPLLIPKVSILLNFVLSRDRMKYLDDFFQLATEIGVRVVSVEHMNMTPVPHVTESPILDDDEEFKELRFSLKKKYGSRLSIFWWPTITSENIEKSSRCRIFWHSIHIDALGRISPCCEWPLATYGGDIFQDTNTWNSSIMSTLRQAMRHNNIPKACRRCACLYEDQLAL